MATWLAANSRGESYRDRKREVVRNGASKAQATKVWMRPDPFVMPWEFPTVLFSNANRHPVLARHANAEFRRESVMERDKIAPQFGPARLVK